MTFTLTYAWWWIPAFITVLSIGYMMIPKDHGGNFPDIGVMIDLILVLLVVSIAWAIGGIAK